MQEITQKQKDYQILSRKSGMTIAIIKAMTPGHALNQLAQKRGYPDYESMCLSWELPANWEYNEYYKIIIA